MTIQANPGHIVPRNKRPRLSTSRYRPSDDSHDNGGPIQVINWDPDCRRNGDRARVAGVRAFRQRGVTSGASFLPSSGEDAQDNTLDDAQDDLLLSFYDEVDSDVEEDGIYDPPNANDSNYIPTRNHQCSGRRKTRTPRIPRNQQTWLIDGTPPPLSITARRIIITLGTIVMPSNIEILARLLQFLRADATTASICKVHALMDPLTAVDNLGLQCMKMETDVHLTDFHFMLVLLQLVLVTDM